MPKSRILKWKFYLNESNVLVQVLNKNERENRVIVYRFDTLEKQHIEFDTASIYLRPMFKIGEVAKMMARKTNTIRKYENMGLVEKPTMYKIKGKNSIRLYTTEEVKELTEFFATRKTLGVNKVTNFKVNKLLVDKTIKSRYVGD